MRICVRCKRGKWWWQFYNMIAGETMERVRLCKSCASELREEAVQEFVKEHEMRYWQENAF